MQIWVGPTLIGQIKKGLLKFMAWAVKDSADLKLIGFMFETRIRFRHFNIKEYRRVKGGTKLDTLGAIPQFKISYFFWLGSCHSGENV